MAVLVEHLQFHTFNIVDFLADTCGLNVESIRVCDSPYPFGKTDPMNQGVPAAMMEGSFTVSDKISASPPYSMARYSQLLKKFLYSLVKETNGNSMRANLIRRLDNTTRTGDHIEVVFRKL